MNQIHLTALEARTSTRPINNLILGRWSPRAMTGEVLKEKELLTLFEAARWAPSAFNEQPWRFIYANRDTPQWQTLFNLLEEFNQAWCEQASALVVMVSTKNFKKNGKPSPTHSFDTGSAWMALALQGAAMGLVVHGMSGFDYEKAQTVLNIPDDVQVEAMCAIGKLAPKESLQGKLNGKLLDMETPSDRLPLSEIIMEGNYKTKKTSTDSD